LVQSVYADFNFAAAGDWGCTSNTDATVTNMNGKSPERVFGLGDYSYASTGTCWFNKIGPIDSITKIAIGNHEDDDSEGFSGYMSHFGLSQTYYSYNYQDVHVLVMDTDRNSYASGSAQRTFVQNDLQAASTNPNIKWIIVYLHKEMYTSPNTCSSSSCSNTGSEPTNLRNGFHPMFDQYGVDLVLQGHVHNYQRTFTLKYDPGSPSSPTITSNNANTYTEGNGEVFALVGTGGVNFHGLSGKASWVSSQQDDFFGQLDIKSTDNGNKLEGKFYRNGNNAILDSFSITKGNTAPVANNQAVTTTKNTAKAITLTATDADNDPLTYSIVTPPAHGTITAGTGASRTYTPNTNYVGPDSFTFKANDGTADSNTATVSITVQDAASCATNLPISGVTASGNEVGNVPSNVLDNNLATRWSSYGIGQWIRADLGSIQNICSVDIAWYRGNERMYHFVIATSTDGTTFTDKFSGDSSGTTLNSEKYIIPATDARYVRVTVNGNTANNWANIVELDIFGTSSSATSSSLYNYGPSLTLSGPSG
jgi:F5/8 type C domain/Bacterial Ig domain/Calcineurin-like phosphoesterase